MRFYKSRGTQVEDDLDLSEDDESSSVWDFRKSVDTGSHETFPFGRPYSPSDKLLSKLMRLRRQASLPPGHTGSTTPFSSLPYMSPHILPQLQCSPSLAVSQLLSGLPVSSLPYAPDLLPVQDNGSRYFPNTKEYTISWNPPANAIMEEMDTFDAERVRRALDWIVATNPTCSCSCICFTL